jgi:aspartate kinase
MKFGGAALATPSHFKGIAKLIHSRLHLHKNIGIVVSAMGNTTDQLISLAKEVHASPPKREYDMLVSAGERISIALLTMALAGEGIEGVSFTGSQSGIITSAHHSEARIVDVRPHRLLKAFSLGKVAIVAGFQGVSCDGEITTLGRGGSDTSAVALAIALQGEKVEFFKDVPGIFQEDPKVHKGQKPFPELSYKEAFAIAEKGAKVLHPRSIALAEKNGIPLVVRTFNSDDSFPDGTWIGCRARNFTNSIYYETE